MFVASSTLRSSERVFSNCSNHVSTWRWSAFSNAIASLRELLPPRADFFALDFDFLDFAMTVPPVTARILIPHASRENACKQSITVRLRSEEHTSELQSRLHLVCRLLLEKK